MRRVFLIGIAYAFARKSEAPHMVAIQEKTLIPVGTAIIMLERAKKIWAIISQVVATFSRKPVFGYLGMVFALLAIMCIGMIV
jgi:hypothetical protein